MDKKSNIVSLSHWRSKKITPKAAPVSNSARPFNDYEKRILELETKLDKVVEVLTEVAEDTSINRKTLLKLLRLLKDKT